MRCSTIGMRYGSEKSVIELEALAQTFSGARATNSGVTVIQMTLHELIEVISTEVQRQDNFIVTATVFRSLANGKIRFLNNLESSL